MRYELLIIVCVSFLNSLTVERGRIDKILKVSANQCENTFKGEDEEDFCECSEGGNTFLSQNNTQYRCGRCLGTLLHFLKLLLFENKNESLTRRKSSLAILFKCLFIQFSFAGKPWVGNFSCVSQIPNFFINRSK